MEYDVAITKDEHRTLVKVAGRPTADQVLSLIHLLGVQSDRWNRPALMFDLRGIETLYTADEMVQFGVAVASSLSHLRRIASVVPPERITRLSERAARRNRVDVKVFGDEDEAIHWLLEIAAPTAR